MSDEQRTMIMTGVKAGRDVSVIAATLGIPETDVRIFVTWWRDRGCPEPAQA